jgi:hemerythrin-like domain-containing protein
MQSRGPLMIEHRLIERMIGVMRGVEKQIEEKRGVDPHLIDAVVDFIRMYADRTHHGKEEDILFTLLAEKALSAEDKRLMDELIQDHILGRKVTRELVAANTAYRNGDASALGAVAASLRTLADFYPVHIRKEDEVFFPASMAYFTAEEDQEILRAYWEFDRKMIHEKYRALVEELKK